MRAVLSAVAALGVLTLVAPAHGADCASHRAQIDERSGAPSRRDAIRLRMARCLRDAGALAEAAAEYRVIATSGPLSLSPGLLDEAATLFAAQSIPLEGSLDSVWSVPPTRDRERREAVARVLFVLTKHPDPDRAARAFDRLWLDFPDTPAGREILATPSGRTRATRATREDAIRRGRVLLDAPDPPAALAALEPFRPIDTDVTPSACEARVLLARTLRRLSRASEALAAARLAAARCDPGPAAEASHLVVLLQSGREEDPESQVEEFLRRFPKDSRGDDVLLQRAYLLARGTEPKRSIPVLERTLERYPGGDMAHDVRFLLALERARAGDVATARRLLDEGARLGPPGDAADRAAYWSARLRLYPRLDRLEASRDAAAKASATASLSSLAASRFGSYYAVLARLLLHKPPVRAGLPLDTEVPVPDRLAADAQFADALALLGYGYLPEAQLVLHLVVDRMAPFSDSERLALACAYRRCGSVGEGFSLLSAAAGRAPVLTPGPAQANAPAAWGLLYPRLFADELDGAALKAGIVPEMLRALAREESTFDARAVSPTGAVGLCQIQRPGATEAARLLRRVVPTPAQLLDPALNATIGATYLRYCLDVTTHPLLAVAAYNRGPTSIKGLARKVGAIPIDTFVERIPARETREYVKRVVGAWEAYAVLDDGERGPSFSLTAR